jgi:KDO2-lipid IV(A) lauroyltransferase
MQALMYYIFYASVWTITLLPMRVLYFISDIVFLNLYYFAVYRKKIVVQNLRNSFPSKSEQEIKTITRNFYRHFSDLLIESFKLVHLSEAELKKRFTVTNIEILDSLLKDKRDTIAILGHYNNWEWLAAFPLYTGYKPISIYKPLQNKYFNNFINNLRSKHGMELTPMSGIMREIIENRRNNIYTVSAFLADQTPVRHEIRYWTTFLNQDTPVYLGPEKVASKFDMAVVYFNIEKVRRGFYNLNIELLFEHTEGLAEYVITERHVRRLEEIVKEKPEYWIWSHRRWKYKKPA